MTGLALDNLEIARVMSHHEGEPLERLSLDVRKTTKQSNISSACINRDIVIFPPP